MKKYQVAYRGQPITEPLSFEEAHNMAIGINADDYLLDPDQPPMAEVVLAHE